MSGCSKVATNSLADSCFQLGCKWTCLHVNLRFSYFFFFLCLLTSRSYNTTSWGAVLLQLSVFFFFSSFLASFRFYSSVVLCFSPLRITNLFSVSFFFPFRLDFGSFLFWLLACKLSFPVSLLINKQTEKKKREREERELCYWVNTDKKGTLFFFSDIAVLLIPFIAFW